MSPGGHLVTTAAACGLVYAGTGSAALTAGLLAGGFLIDIDHVFDYIIFERQRDLRPSAFLRYYLEGKVRRVVLPLHSYELLALLIVLARAGNWDWLWGYVLGMALHLPLDIVFNGRLVPGGLVHFYSFAVRARAGFRAERFADPRRLAPLTENFWIVFFRGSRLKNPGAKADRQPAVAPLSTASHGSAPR
ncbi:MAG TPA: hypothetical protein VEL75_03260 [Candidatus Methylomirabilis sp.]|nr:hypothetical protein [Candidatus Methylomirabilis sp.]